MIQETRIKPLNEKRMSGHRPYVIYWMQASQRAACNHALEYAIHQANELEKPLLVFFGITDRYPGANERHYAFMLEGLKEVKHDLARRGIHFVVQHQSPELGIIELSKQSALVVVDRGYTRIQKKWREEAAVKINCPLIEVETDVIVPVETASPKREFSAATFRSKITKQLSQYLVPLKKIRLKKSSYGIRIPSFQIEDVEKALSRIKLDRNVKQSKHFHGGASYASQLLKAFIERKLQRFEEFRNDPNQDATSNLSPYLHFGQISPLEIALKVNRVKKHSKNAYLEELIVRRELSINFVHYTPDYDQYEALPDWCRKTLSWHKRDKREYVYSLREFEQANTHDPYWNAAQNEMKITGKMHGYMRMYWGKKILEWSRTPEGAFRTALYLNDKYELDGRDPNGFAGVAWCFGNHDRPWAERAVFGNVRYMNDRGLVRKFDADAYVKKIEKL